MAAVDMRKNIPAAGMRKAAAPYDLSRNIGVACNNALPAMPKERCHAYKA